MAQRRSIARLVLFDLDGTLVDSAPDLYDALCRLMAREGRARIAEARLRAVVSKGGMAMLAAGFPDLDDAARAELLPHFLSLYGEAIAERSRLFDGIGDALDAIEASGARWGVVTNKPERLAVAVVDALGLGPRAALLIGGDTLSRKKPDPLQLVVACERLGVAPGDAVYVGDDERDVLAARAAGMRCVAAAWGYRDDGEDIAGWRADAIAQTPRDLLAPGMLAAYRAAA